MTYMYPNHPNDDLAAFGARSAISLGSKSFTRWLVDTSIVMAQGHKTRVPTRPGKRGKPGKMRVHLENLEISWNFEKINRYHGKMT